MDTAIQTVLARHYGYAKGAAKKLGPPTAAELASVKKAGFIVDQKTVFTHDDSVRRLRAVAMNINPALVLNLFLVALSGRYRRGCQPVLSYAFARHLEDHTGTYQPGYQVCTHCGLEKRTELDVTHETLRLHLGWSWNELLHFYVIDLEEILSQQPPEPDDADRRTLHNVLALAAQMPAKATPGQFEKALASKKLIPETDRYKRYGLLEGLATLGVLPNQVVAPAWACFVTWVEILEASRKVRGGPNSDIVLPFGGWRGALGVDMAKANALFGC